MTVTDVTVLMLPSSSVMVLRDVLLEGVWVSVVEDSSVVEMVSEGVDVVDDEDEVRVWKLLVICVLLVVSVTVGGSGIDWVGVSVGIVSEEVSVGGVSERVG